MYFTASFAHIQQGFHLSFQGIDSWMNVPTPSLVLSQKIPRASF